MAIQGNNYWTRGSIIPWWSFLHRTLDYRNEPFNDPESEARWRELGYTQTKFTGDMYDMRRPEPDWIAPFRKHFQFVNFSWSFYRMSPGTTLPEHSDTYVRFKEIYHVPNDQDVVRVVVFLDDWQSGHYFEIAGHPIVQWRVGDWVMWKNDCPHIAANVGSSDRYTLQITGL